MSENQTQESSTKKANNSTQDDRRLRTWQRLPAPTEQEQGSVADILNRTPSSLLTRREISWPRTAVVQTKLTVNEPDDMYEQEADRVADTVMRMANDIDASDTDSSLPQTNSPHPQITAQTNNQSVATQTNSPHLATQTNSPQIALRHKQNPNASSEREVENESEAEEVDWLTNRVMHLPYHTSAQSVAESNITPIQAKLIHRACAACEEETLAARQAAYQEPPAVTANIENRIQNMNGSGSPLPDSERSFFESRLGADLSGVRIHTDSSAVQTSRDLSARAFTVGNNIAFNSGEYQPGTSAGRHLLAHELTHTVQQGAAPQLKRKLEAPEAEKGSQEEAIEEEKGTEAVEKSQELTMAPEGDETRVARSPEESMGSTGGAAPKEVISLEADTFNPSAAFDTYFEENEGASAEVEATLGNLAKGSIEVEKSGDGYQTKGGNAQAIAFTHPVLAPLASANVTPVLGVKIQGNAISGFLTIGTPGEPAPDISKLVNWIKDNPEAMGWLGFDLKNFPSTTNELEGGVLQFNVEGFKFKLGGFLEGSGSFKLENTTASFEANADIRIEGLTESSLEISGDSGGNLKGSANIPVSLDKFSGTLNATYDNGTVEIKGKAAYETEKLSGEVNLIVTDEATASSVAQQQLGADSIIESAEATAGSGGGEAKDGPRAMAGWGTLDFRFTEWLTGQAQVIIDNKGQITVVGEIAPPAEVEIFPQKDYIKELFKVEVRAQYGVPLLANVFLFGNVGMEAVAKIGPAKLYNIKIEGTYSTDPNVLNDFSLQGTLNMSAFAGLRLTVEGGAGSEILDHDVKAGIGIDAMGGVKGYVEATPTIGYREQAAPSEGKQGDFYIKGHMELAGQPFIGLGGELFVELDSPWWSPAGDHKWPWDLGSLEYPLPGEFGIGADVDYTIGSGKMPEIQFGEVDFNSEKFMTDLVNDHVPPKSDKPEQQGEWQEDSTSGAGNVDPTVTDSEGPPPKDATLGGKQEEGIGKVPPPDIEKQWQAGLSALGNLAKTSQEEPLTKDEIQKSLKSSGFDDVRIQPTGEDFTVYVSMGDLTNEKKPAVIKGKGGEDVQAAIDALYAAEKAEAGENGISEKEAQTIAQSTKAKHPVFESITPVEGKESWDYEYTVQTDKLEGQEPKEIGPEVGTYSELQGKYKDHEAHHVPPKGLLAWLVQQAEKEERGLSQEAIESGEYQWLSNLARVSEDTYNPGNDLAAITVHESTHIKKDSANPGQNVWRIHWGQETAKEVLQRLHDKGLRLIYKTKFHQLDEEDKARYIERVREAGESEPTPEEQTTSEQLGEKEPQEVMLSTQFFKTELDAALEEEKKLNDAETERFKTSLSNVGKGAAAQAHEAVVVALSHSIADGTPEQKNDALTKLKPKSKETWNNIEGIAELGIIP